MAEETRLEGDLSPQAECYLYEKDMIITVKNLPQDMAIQVKGQIATIMAHNCLQHFSRDILKANKKESLSMYVAQSMDDLGCQPRNIKSWNEKGQEVHQKNQGNKI